MTMQAKTEKYQGWANWETWNVALWAGNDEPLYRKVLERVRVVGKFTAESAKGFMLFEMPNGTPDFNSRRRQGALFAAAYEKVDWREIADNFNEMAGQ